MCLETALVAMGMSAATAASVSTGISMASSIMGVVTSTMGAFNQSQARADTSAYRAGVARNNAIIAERQAVDRIKRGKEDADRQRLRGRMLEGRQLVGLAGQGGDVTVGSNIDLLADTAELSEFDAQTIEVNAKRDANSIRAQASNFTAQSQLYDYQSAAENPLLDATTTALSGFGSISAKWYKNNNPASGITWNSPRTL